MNWRKIWQRGTAWIVTKALTLYLKTLRLHIAGAERVKKELSLKERGCIFLLWHDSLLICPVLKWITDFQPISILISNSRDGDLASEIAKQFRNVHIIRVKHTARGGALAESCKLLASGTSLIITPDGPRGPRHQIKLGALFASQKTGAVMIPVVYAASSQKNLSSWDQFKIPLPFSRIAISFLEPVCCPQDTPLDTIQTEIAKKMEQEEERLKASLQ